MLKVALGARYLAAVSVLAWVGAAQAQQPNLQQDAGPLQSAVSSESVVPGGSPEPPVASDMALPAALPTDVGTLNQLVAQMLSGPNGTNPAVLASVVNILTNPPSSSRKAPPSLSPSLAPTPLAPVFDVPQQAQASPR